MSKVNLQATCPKCGEELILSADVNTVDAPSLRCGLKPSLTEQIYYVNSDFIKRFIREKARLFLPEVKIEVVPVFCQAKKKKFEPGRSYAFFRIAFNDDIVDDSADQSWYYRIGTDNENVRIEKSIYANIIKKYSYDINALDEWRKSYKTLDQLEEAFGITEVFLNDIRMYARPVSIQDNNKNRWIIFSAAAENIIKDMFTDPSNNELAGNIEIRDIKKINNDLVEFEIHLKPKSATSDPENMSLVKNILLGKDKPKK